MEGLTKETNSENQVEKVEQWELDLEKILTRSKYSLKKNKSEVRYGPPANWAEPAPTHVQEVFIGALPKVVSITELITLFDSKLGEDCLYELCLMLDLMGGVTTSGCPRNRGYGFATFRTKDLAKQCRDKLDLYEVRPGKKMRINVSAPNLHLFVANVPRNKTREELLKDLQEYTDGLCDVMVFAAKNNEGETDKKRHRGFIFLEFDIHNNAANARRKLTKPGFRLWNRELRVDWADKKHEPDQEIMSKVKSLYVRNLTADSTDVQLKEIFSKHGEVERIKKVRDFAFVHFKERGPALAALEALNKTVLPDKTSNGLIDIELVRPNISKYQQQHQSLLAASQYQYRMAAAMSMMFPPPFQQMGGSMPMPPPYMMGPPPPMFPTYPMPPFMPVPPGHMAMRQNRNWTAMPNKHLNTSSNKGAPNQQRRSQSMPSSNGIPSGGMGGPRIGPGFPFSPALLWGGPGGPPRNNFHIQQPHAGMSQYVPQQRYGIGMGGVGGNQGRGDFAGPMSQPINYSGPNSTMPFLPPGSSHMPPNSIQPTFGGHDKRLTGKPNPGQNRAGNSGLTSNSASGASMNSIQANFYGGGAGPVNAGSGPAIPTSSEEWYQRMERETPFVGW